ncbi:hypothetical protein QR680_001198 [Steinernema hermaphroditum]|uniref:Pepsin inhibitor-3-like repeated domain-containing protein n=1 Tax=Steinernema hermaphroditum TaxID=289476 RepID=A0AA39GZ97_9BILA|nr:hypothetical protein QR680_001198 [Steinernema hermaphroditum]
MSIMLSVLVICVACLGSALSVDSSSSKIGLKGYIGPACAVVDQNLYLHGLFVRKLTVSEVSEFKKYQDGVQLVKTLSEIKFLSNDINLPAPPQIPDFCGGLDDSVEVVLEGCTVRNSRVFIQDKLIRPLNGLERDKINNLLTAKSFPKMVARIKRQDANMDPKSSNAAPEDPLLMAQNDISLIIERLLNVNATVAKRFLPVAQMSPLLAHVEQATRPGVNDYSRDFAKSLDVPRSSRDVADVQNNTKPTEVTTEVRVESAPATSTSTSTPSTTAAPTNSIQDSPKSEKTVHDPVILQLVQALLNRQNQLKQPGESSSSNAYSATASNPEFNSFNHNQPSPPRFIIPVNMGNGLRAGDKTVIGGQTYLAVPMNPMQSGPLPMLANSLGSLASAPQPSPTQTHGNGYGSDYGESSNYYSPVRYNAGSLYNQNAPNLQQASAVGHENATPLVINSNHPRYHPGSNYFASSPPQLPNEICKAHIIE